jgi:hypothetical protein
MEPLAGKREGAPLRRFSAHEREARAGSFFLSFFFFSFADRRALLLPLRHASRLRLPSRWAFVTRRAFAMRCAFVARRPCRVVPSLRVAPSSCVAPSLRVAPSSRVAPRVAPSSHVVLRAFVTRRLSAS